MHFVYCTLHNESPLLVVLRTTYLVIEDVRNDRIGGIVRGESEGCHRLGAVLARSGLTASCGTSTAIHPTADLRQSIERLAQP